MKKKDSHLEKEEILEDGREEETKAQNTETETEELKDQPSEEPIKEDPISLLKQEKEALNDKYLRLYSEFDNFRKRTQKEKLELYKTAGEDVIISILPVIDDLERALKSIDETENIKDVKKGFTLILQKIQNSLTQKGVKSIESPVGKEFDLNIHEAISKVPAPTKKLKGKIIEEVEKGYLLNEKVIRYTKVVIGE